MHRWFILIGLFVCVFIGSLWTYIYLHRKEYAQLSLAYAYPSSIITVGPISVSMSGTAYTVEFDGIEIHPVQGSQDDIIRIKRAEAQINYFPFLSWALWPTDNNLRIHKVVLEADSPIEPNTLPSSIPTNFFVEVDTVNVSYLFAGKAKQIVSPEIPLTIREIIDLSHS